MPDMLCLLQGYAMTVEHGKQQFRQLTAMFRMYSRAFMTFHRIVVG